MHQTNMDEAISLLTRHSTVSGNLPVIIVCFLLCLLLSFICFGIFYAQDKNFSDSLSASLLIFAMFFIASCGGCFAIFSTVREQLQTLRKNVIPSNTFYIYIGDIKEKGLNDSGIHVVSGKPPENFLRDINYLSYHIESVYCDKQKSSCRVFFKAGNNNKTIYDVDLMYISKYLADKPLHDTAPLNSDPSEKAAFTSSSLPH